MAEERTEGKGCSTARYDRLFWAIFFTLFAAKLALLFVTPYELAPDEAHYWEWSRRLDFAYYSKGPIIAFLIAASTKLLGHTAFAVRLPILLTAAGFLFIFYLTVRRFTGPATGVISFLVLSSMPFFAALGLGATTDSPCFFFWMAALGMAITALSADRPWWWAGAGLFLGLAVLAKYTALIMLPCIAVTLLLERTRRRHLTSPGFLAGVLLFACAVSPLICWNLQHGWVNFQHNAGHFSPSLRRSPFPRYFLELLGGQWLLVGPLLFPILSMAVPQCIRAAREPRAIVLRFVLGGAALLLTLCVAVSFFRPVYANWPVPMLFHVLLAFALSAGLCSWAPITVRSLFGTALVLNAALIAFAYVVLLGFDLNLPLARSPLKRTVGWKALGQELGRLREQSGIKFIMANDDYGMASEMAFYTPGHPEVLCFNEGSRRMNQYDLWVSWPLFRGQDFLIVQKTSEVSPALRAHFARIEPLHPPLDIRYAGAVVRSFYFHKGVGFDGRAPEPPKKGV